jgi:hypothetical protein
LPATASNGQSVSSDAESVSPDQPDTVFLLFLTGGKHLELFELSRSSTVFYLRVNGAWELLENREDAGTPPYKVKLGQYAAKYELFDKLGYAIDHTQYDADNLSTIVDGINQSSDKKYYTSKDFRKAVLSWFISVGGGSTRLSPEVRDCPHRVIRIDL